jgi:hypothetical protein
VFLKSFSANLNSSTKESKTMSNLKEMVAAMAMFEAMPDVLASLEDVHVSLEALQESVKNGTATIADIQMDVGLACAALKEVIDPGKKRKARAPKVAKEAEAQPKTRKPRAKAETPADDTPAKRTRKVRAAKAAEALEPKRISRRKRLAAG